MTELLRDTLFGHVVRFVTKARYFQYAEEKDPSLWKRYLSSEKTEHMAHHGSTGQDVEGVNKGAQEAREAIPSTGSSSTRLESFQTPISEGSSSTHIETLRITNTIGQKIDQEKGRDVCIIEWFGNNDQENPMNWSSSKKVFVTAEICLLTTSVYIGSAIYSAGTETVMMDFGVSQVAATLGLTLFVAGYGLGPMIWAPMSEIPQIVCQFPERLSFALLPVCRKSNADTAMPIGP